MTRRLLDGIRVVSVEQAVAAPLCTRHLVELGADVVKVERPDGGDFARGYDKAVKGTSAHFAWLNGGKRSVALDLTRPVDRQVFDRLLARSDVFVCNLAPAARERLVADAGLAATHPELVRCYISGYGVDGPYSARKAFDSLVQGEAGLIASTGTPSAPAKSGISVADVGAGTYALALIASALASREHTGIGCRIDVSLYDVLTYWLSPLLVAERNGTPAPPPAGAHHATIVPYGPYRCRDGQLLNIAVQNDGQWQRFCTIALDAPELASDARWSTNAGRAAGRAELEPVLAGLVARHDAPDLIGRFDEADIPWGHINSVAEVARHPQLEQRRRWQVTPLENGASGEVLAAPFEVDGDAAPPAAVPSLGEDTADLMAELGFSPTEIDSVSRWRSGARHP